VVLNPDRDISTLILEELAIARARPVSEIETLARAAGGDLEIDSKEGQFVAVRLEIHLGLPGLIRPEDQNRHNLTTISSLTRLIERRVDDQRSRAQAV
jgi:hypothetical protein